MWRGVLMAGFVVLCFGLPAFAADDEPRVELSHDEHAELIRLLDESFTKLIGLISGLSEEQWTFKENPDRWSVGECTEHIVRSEQILLEMTKKAFEGDPDPEWEARIEGKLGLLKQVMPNRNPGGAGGATAPMEIRPTEKWGRGKAIAEFYRVRGAVRALVETLDGPVKDRTYKHPFPVFGWLSAHELLIYVPLHTIRHSKQIIEVQEAEGYPEG